MSKKIITALDQLIDITNKAENTLIRIVIICAACSAILWAGVITIGIIIYHTYH